MKTHSTSGLYVTVYIHVQKNMKDWAISFLGYRKSITYGPAQQGIYIRCTGSDDHKHVYCPEQVLQ